MKEIKQMLSLMECIDPKYKQYKQTLNEGDSRLKLVDRILNERFRNLLPLDDTVSSSDYYVNDNPNTTWRQYLLFHLRHEFSLMTNQDVKYLPVVARLAYSDDVRFDMADDNTQEVNLLKRVVGRMKKDDALFQEVKQDTGMTLERLAERFKGEFEREDKMDAEEANSVARTDEYKILEVTDFETAKYYGDRSCSSSKLCYTQDEGTWKNWTKHGLNTVYVCLRKGWEDIPEKATKDNPYDLYGTSMIFAFVSPKGELLRSNCRWNHHNTGKYVGGVDNAFTKSSLSRTVGVPFDEVFKPRGRNISEAELISMIEKSDDGLSELISGDFVIPNGTRYIGAWAFFACTGLTSVVIPDSVTAIGQEAFNGCTDLTSVTIPNSVTYIGASAFHDCTGLTSVTIPDSVTEIGLYAFTGCSGLTSIIVDSGNIVFNDGNGSNCIIATATNALFFGCQNTVIPNSVKCICQYAFHNCTGLTSMDIPDSVTNIGRLAFNGCTRLTSVTIPNSVTRVGRRAFDSCPNLTIYVRGNDNIYNQLKSWNYNVQMVQSESRYRGVMMEALEQILLEEMDSTICDKRTSI